MFKSVINIDNFPNPICKERYSYISFSSLPLRVAVSGWLALWSSSQHRVGSIFVLKCFWRKWGWLTTCSKIQIKAFAELRLCFRFLFSNYLSSFFHVIWIHALGELLFPLTSSELLEFSFFSVFFSLKYNCYRNNKNGNEITCLLF